MNIRPLNKSYVINFATRVILLATATHAALWGDIRTCEQELVPERLSKAAPFTREHWRHEHGLCN